MTDAWDSEPDLTQLGHAYALMRVDPQAALVELHRLADRGSVMSMMYIGHANSKGIGTQIDLPQAAAWYRRAADRGSLFALYKVGRIYWDMGNYPKAVEAFNEGATRNDAPSMHMLGLMYLEGNGVPVDINRARALFESAVERGNVFAKRNLGALLIGGRFGLTAIFRGAYLLASGFKDAIHLSFTDRFDDRLR
jgi:uncharacterized protein